MSMGMCNWAPMPPSSSSKQTAAWFDLQLGRRPTPTPAHLTGVLYIPRHDDKTTHLPIYEAGRVYRQAVGDSLLGSTVHATKLGLMTRPRGDNLNHQVEYITDIRRGDDGKVDVRLERRQMGSRGLETRLTMEPTCDARVPRSINIETNENLKICRMEAFFPILPTTRGSETIQHPYFTLTALRHDVNSIMPARLQWQIQPVEHGFMRYTLLDEYCPENHNKIWAIYHDMGWEKPLSHGCSEGVLLLPEISGDASGFEAIVVVSILGLLAQLRMLRPKRIGATMEVGRLGWLKKVFQRF